MGRGALAFARKAGRVLVGNWVFSDMNADQAWEGGCMSKMKKGEAREEAR